MFVSGNILSKISSVIIKNLSYYVKNADIRDFRCIFADSENFAIEENGKKKERITALGAC